MNGRFENRRVWLIGGVLAALVIVAASWFMLIKPNLDDAATVRADAESAEMQNVQASAANAKLKREFPTVPAMQAKLAKLLAAVPATSALPAFTLEANARAHALDVSLQNLSITAPVPVTTGATTGTASTSGTSTGDAAATTTPQGTTASGSAATTPNQIGVTFTAEGSTTDLVDYVKSMQHGVRDILVSSANLSAREGAKSTITVSAYVFTAPMTSDQTKQTSKLLKSTR